MSQVVDGEAEQDACRICKEIVDISNANVISPCKCDGSVKYIHIECFQRWYQANTIDSCEICRTKFPVIIRETINHQPQPMFPVYTINNPNNQMTNIVDIDRFRNIIQQLRQNQDNNDNQGNQDNNDNPMLAFYRRMAETMPDNVDGINMRLIMTHFMTFLSDPGTYNLIKFSMAFASEITKKKSLFKMIGITLGLSLTLSTLITTYIYHKIKSNIKFIIVSIFGPIVLYIVFHMTFNNITNIQYLIICFLYAISVCFYTSIQEDRRRFNLNIT